MIKPFTSCRTIVSQTLIYFTTPIKKSSVGAPLAAPANIQGMGSPMWPPGNIKQLHSSTGVRIAPLCMETKPRAAV